MKAFTRFLCLGLVLGLLPSLSMGALSGRKNTLLGKFHASNVHGTVTCIADGRITELKKGDTVLARGTIIDTAAGANATLVFSNGTGVYVDEKTKFTVKIFEQEFFTPNNNLRVEPSNSNTLVALSTGRVVISTPRLLGGTTMIYETDLASVRIRGEKVMIETNEKQTHVAMIEDTASVNPRGTDGNFVSIGKRLVTGREAFVKYTLGGNEEDSKKIDAAKPSSAGGVALGEAATASAQPEAPAHRPTSVSTSAVAQDTEATVLKVIGSVHARPSAQAQEGPVAEGARLPKGAVIRTEEGAELYLQPFPGAVATLRPHTIVLLEKLAVTVEDGVVTKQTALLNLTAGTVVSTIDPAKREINDYGVRSPSGIASAQGTSFTVSIDANGSSVATTADSVIFTLPSGATYTIKAGSISQTDAAGSLQPPIPINQALAANPALAGLIQTAVTTVANVVQNNLGGLSSDSAANLLTKVLTVATTALPGQATAFTNQAITAVNAPGSATSANPGVAAAAVTTALITAAPEQAVQIAAAAASSAPNLASTIAAAAAKTAPARAEQIAVAVAQTFISGSALSASNTEKATQIAAAVAAAVPAKAAPVAAAVMQLLVQANPQATPLANAQVASSLAAAVTASAPDQAVPVAAIMMKVLTQASPDATPLIISQSAAMLASAVTSVVPPQAQQVATAVMQLLVQVAPEAASQSAGLIAAAVSQVAPDQSGAVTQALATASSQPLSAVQASAAAAAEQGAAIAQTATAAANQGGQASQTGNSASTSATQGYNDAQSYAQSGGGQGGEAGDGASSDTSTSIIVVAFENGAYNKITPDLEAAENAQSGVQFTPDPVGGTVNPPTPTIPPTNPIDSVASPAKI